MKEKPSVVHIDDEDDFLEVFKLTFKDRLEITSLINSSDAIEKIKTQKFDAIITDYEMPKINGLELLKNVRQHCPDKPVIFLTGQGNEEVAREAFKAGASDYFTKDFGFAHKEKMINSVITSIEKHKTEQALHMSQEMLTELVNNMTSGVVVFEANDEGDDFFIKEFNCAAEKIEKVSKDEVINKSVLEVFPGIREFGLFDVLRRVWITGLPEKFPLKLYKDDRIKGWRDNYVYRLSSGHIVTIYDDVTEIMKAKEALKASEHKFRQLFHNANDLIFLRKVTSPGQTGNFIEVNDVACKKLGYSRDEFLKMKLDDLIVPEYKEFYTIQLAKLFREEHVTYETVLISKDKKRLHVETSSHLFELSGEKVILSIMRDISERKKIRSELLNSDVGIKYLSEDAPFAYQSLDENGFIQEVNKYWLFLTGYSEAEVIGKWFGHFLTPESRVDFIESFALSKESGTIQNIEFNLILKNKKVIAVEFEGKIIQDENGITRQAHCIFKDITRWLQLLKATGYTILK